ncbi:MAG: hypothetical protein LCH63_14060 [Candidatus Melainabacteria bacterium]|nr:hypothetical protein [Candidatus Melainabacteria bacterium]
MAASETSKKRANAFVWAVVLYGALNLALYGVLAKMPERKLSLNGIKATNYEKRMEGPWIWWVSRTYLSQLEQKAQPDIVLFGSSQMGSAIFSAEAEHRGTTVDTTDQREVERLAAEVAKASGLKPRVFNFSMGGAMVSDHYLIADSLVSKADEKPKIAIIGVNPRDFIDNNLPAAAATDSFHFLSPYCKLDNLAVHSYDSPFGYLDYLLSRYLPLRQVNLLAFGDIPPSLGARASFTNPEGKGIDTRADKKANNAQLNSGQVTTKVLRAISGSAGDVKRGEWVLPAYPPYLYMDNSKEYIKRYKRENPPCLAGQKRYFQELLALLHKENIQIIVVGMPSRLSNQNLLSQNFWNNFDSYLEKTTKEQGGTYVSLFKDQRFVEEKDYLDTVHLNRWGGGKLVKIMAETVSGNTAMVQALKECKSDAVAGRDKPGQKPL